MAAFALCATVAALAALGLTYGLLRRFLTA